jgi:hypothetical protein
MIQHGWSGAAVSASAASTLSTSARTRARSSAVARSVNVTTGMLSSSASPRSRRSTTRCSIR